ncbi:hypothetical protein [uncultured Duncaniella sp.]|uniref:hypothetical protein n=2 Tax=uncultured Duncaniella sp. TaxID=2768039 RepID=UPI00261F12D2|nr:hypothetical protein [uncultured Duncaniella sp.]
MKTTRPEFLLELMSGGDYGALDMGGMKKAFQDTNALCYCVYTVLMEADIDKSDIEFVNNDGESIAIKFRNKTIPVEVKKLCNKEVVRYGKHKYKVKLKVRDKNLIAEVKQLEPDSDDIADSDEE